MTFERISEELREKAGDDAQAFSFYLFDRPLYDIARDRSDAGDALCEKYGKCLERYLSGEPLQYIFGYTPFYDLLINCRPGVLIPRYDTETLVEQALKTLPSGALFCDMCCGSGCIAAAVLKHRPDTRAVCCDISDTALELTREILLKYGLEDRAEIIRFDVFGDWSVLPRVDAILCNPPYINAADMEKLPENVRREPREALYGGVDGLDFYRRVIKASNGVFRGTAHIIFEIGYDQGAALKRLSPYDCEIKKDLSGNDRVCILRG